MKGEEGGNSKCIQGQKKRRDEKVFIINQKSVLERRDANALFLSCNPKE